MKLYLPCILALICSTSLPANSGTPMQVITTDTHRFEEVADNVYFVTGTGKIRTDSNSMVVVGQEEVLVVDSHVTADAAHQMLKSIKAITDLPVHYLINTHYHFDHAHGNQAFPDNVEIIGHPYTRDKLLGDVLKGATYQVIGSPKVETQHLHTMEAEQLRSDRAGQGAQNTAIQRRKRHIKALKAVTPTPPNITFENKLTLYRGGREIELLFLGRGHTAGDVVVFLPREKIMFTGDLLMSHASYLGDSYPLDWIKTLEKLKSLDVDLYLPGHGEIFRDTSLIDTNQQFLRDFWHRVKELSEQGLTRDQLFNQFSLPDYEAFDSYGPSEPEVRKLEVQRVYDLITGAH